MRKLLCHLGRGVVLFVLVWVSVTVVLPIANGYLGYAANFGGVYEQIWLDRAIMHLKDLRQGCDDKELADVLDYTIKRYNRIGPFDVAVSRCDWYPISKDSIIGYNNPLVPGITLDIANINDYSLHFGAGTLVHEALHDYYPYFGHKHIYPIMAKYDARYLQMQRE
jgi:hypothetical protein